MVNDIKSSKYFTSFREYIKAKSLDFQALKYSDLVIEYENFLLYNDLIFNQNFKDLKQNEFIKDFEEYLVNTNKLSTLGVEESALIRPKLNEFKDLIAEFIESKMQNNINKNIYNYLNSEPIDNIEPEKFTYLDNDNDKRLSVIQPNNDLNEYEIKFDFNLDPTKTIINFVKEQDKYLLNLSN
ncbi:UNVERIFIED_CONTAM: hypothetical protein O8I53_13640 [Campylobacter lari]